MTLAELKAQVKRIVQDPDYDDELTGFINTAVMETAGKILPDGRRIKLPDLDATDTITTVSVNGDDFPAAMPTDFHHSLYWVGSAAQCKRIGRIEDYENFRTFLRRYPDPALDATGAIQEVARRGKSFYYQPLAVDTLTRNYYRKPVAMVEDTDEPDGIPESLHASLLVNHAAWKIYDEIEDGIEDPKTNTNHYLGLYMSAVVNELVEGIMLDGEPVYVTDAFNGEI